MNVSRRTLIRTGALGVGALGLGGLTACSTAAPGTGSSPGASGAA